MTQREFRKGLEDLGNGLFAWLQPDGSWGYSNAGLVTDGEASLLVDTLFDLPLTRAVADAVPVPVIASGGVGNLDHLADGVEQGHAEAVLAASIFHFGTYTIAEAKSHMAGRGLVVRT